MKEQDEIKELYQSTFEGDQKTPPSVVKDKIDKQIRLQNKAHTPKKIGWLLFTILIGIGIFYFLPLKKETKIHSTNTIVYQKSSLNPASTDTVKLETEHANLPRENRSIVHSKLGSKLKKIQTNKTRFNQAFKSESNVRNLTTTNKLHRNKESKSFSHSTQKIASFTSSNHTNKTSKRKTEQKEKAETNSNDNHEIFPNSIFTQTGFTEIKENLVSKNQQTNSNLTLSSENNSKVATELTDDSTKSTDILIEQKPLIETPTPKKTSILLSFRAGTTFPINQISTTKSFNLKEKKEIYSNFDATYYLLNKHAINVGVQIDKSQELISETHKSFSDSSIVNYLYTYVIDSNQIIIDSIAHPVYDSLTTFTPLHSNYSLFSFALPIYYQFSLPLKSNIWLDLNAGFSINYQRSKILTSDLLSSEHHVNSLGLKACLRMQLRYQFNQFGVSITSNFGYNFKPTQSWVGVERKRIYLGVGLGLHYLIGKK
jgi:hypothetical protein